MAIWADDTRSRASGFYAQRAAEAQKLIGIATAAAAGCASGDIRLMLASYVDGVCSYADHLHQRFRTAINQAGIRAGFLSAGKTFFGRTGDVDRNLLALLCPELLQALYAVRDNTALEPIALLEPCPNELADGNFPAPMNRRLHRPTRPAVCAYATTDAVVYADPFRYQVLSRDQAAMWASGSPRALSRTAIGNPAARPLDRDVIVLQDRFNFTNFAHFLFDGVTRALLLHQRLGSLDGAVLLFGGVPGDFQSAVCAALSEVLRLDPRNLYFPDGPVLLEPGGRGIWFSDQIETDLHPAQMAHPISIDLLRSLVALLPGAASPLKRVYVSRADARQRRVANEEQVTAALAGRGFHAVELGRLPVAAQIGLFRGAEAIVAPHGMGLSHLVAADHLNGVVELHTPADGTDAFALISRAGGIDYKWIVGTAADSPAADFVVPLGQVVRSADAIAGGAVAPSWHKPVNLIAGSAIVARLTAVGDGGPAGRAVPQLLWGNAVLPHRIVPAPERAEANLGGCRDIAVIAGIVYTASCWVWIPDSFAGIRVRLRLGEWPESRVAAADLACRQAWQRISITGVAAAARCEVTLCVAEAAGGWLFSTCWQLERGPEATAYVATR